MKLFLLPFLTEPLPSISDVKVLPDNVIINSGKQLFKPEWVKGLAYTPVVLVKMAKVAKCIAPRFTERYYEKTTLGLSFVATSIDDDIPEQMKYCFDDSLVRGDLWLTMDELVGLEPNIVQIEGASPLEEQPCQSIIYPSSSLIADSISYLSKYFMLKIGDIIAFPLWTEREAILPEQGVFVTDTNEKELLYCGVK